MWCDDVSSFEGEFYNLPPCVQGPKSEQKTHLPIVFGGESTPTLHRVAEFGQGGMGFRLTLQTLPERFVKLGQLLSAYGRSIAEIEIAVSPCDTDCNLDTVKRFADLGVDQIILRGCPGELDDMLRLIGTMVETRVVPVQHI